MPSDPGFRPEFAAYSADEDRISADTGEDGVLAALLAEVSAGANNFVTVSGTKSAVSATRQLEESEEWTGLKLNAEEAALLVAGTASSSAALLEESLSKHGMQMQDVAVLSLVRLPSCLRTREYDEHWC